LARQTVKPTRMRTVAREETVGLFDLLYDPRTDKWVWLFDDHTHVAELTNDEMLAIKDGCDTFDLNIFEQRYVVKDDGVTTTGFEMVVCDYE
jgi:hypothetical protein